MMNNKRHATAFSASANTTASANANVCMTSSSSTRAYQSTTFVEATARSATEQQQQQPVLVPPTALSSCALPRWATLELPLPIIESSSSSSSILVVSSFSTNSTTTKAKEEDDNNKDEPMVTALLSREEAFLRTQTYHSISLQLDNACQQAMHRLYVGDDDDENDETTAATARAENNQMKKKTSSIQQALETLFQETAAATGTPRATSSSSFSTVLTTTARNKTVAIRPLVNPNENDDDNNNNNNDKKMDESRMTRKREYPDINKEEEEKEKESPKRVRLEEKEEEQQSYCSKHLELLRNRFLSVIAPTVTPINSSTRNTSTTTTATTTNQVEEQAVVIKNEKNSFQPSLSSSLQLLLPVLLIQGPYHAMDRLTWMQFLVEQCRSRTNATAAVTPRPAPPPAAVVWLRPAAGLVTSWPEEILRQLLVLLQSTANHYMSTTNSCNNAQLAEQAQLAWIACCRYCPMTGRKRKRKSNSHFVNHILQIWARHVDGLFSGIVVCIDVLDTLTSSSSSNVNIGSASTATSPDHSTSASSSSLDWKDLLAWLSHQRAGHGLPVSCVVVVPPSPAATASSSSSANNGNGLLSFDSSSSLQGIGAGMNVKQVILPTSYQFLTTLQDSLQQQQQQQGHSSSSSNCHLLQLVQHLGDIVNQQQHEHDDPNSAHESSSSLWSSLAAIPALMDWKRYLAQILTRRSSFLPFWLLQDEQQQQQQNDLKLHVSWFLRHTRGRAFLLQESSNKNALMWPLDNVGISCVVSSIGSNNIPSDSDDKNRNEQTPRLWQWLHQSRQWHLLVEMARSIEQAATAGRQKRTTTRPTTAEPSLLQLQPLSNREEQNDQPLEYDNRRAILAILFHYRQQVQLQSQPCKNDKDTNSHVSCLESHSADAVDREYYGQRLSRYLLERPFANDEHNGRRILHQINQLIILVDQCTQVSQVRRLVVAPILKGWTRHLEWLVSSTSSSSLVQQAQPRRQTTAGLLAQSLGSTTCLPISSLERLPGILYGLISNRVSIPQEEWFYEYFQRLRQYQQQTQEQRCSRQEAFALFCCGTHYLKILGLIKERRRQQRTVGATSTRAAVAGGGQKAASSSATTTTTAISGIVYDKISLVFCGGND